MKSVIKNSDKIKADMRKVAISLAKRLPVESEAFADAVDDYLKRIMRLPRQMQYNLKSAYVFSSKVPREEQQDVFQTLTLALIEAKPVSEKLAYAIARRDWVDWYRHYKVKSQYGLTYSLDTDTDADNTRQLAEVLVGECDFELRMEAKLDAQAIWNQLPDRMREIVRKRLAGTDCERKTGLHRGQPYKQYALSNADRCYLHDWIKHNPFALVSEGIIQS